MADVRQLIVSVLKKHPEGLTVEELSKLADVNRVTLSKYLYGLLVEAKVKQRKVGAAKLTYLK